jgi:multicomponent Na+:H+ antiporter subunit F
MTAILNIAVLALTLASFLCLYRMAKGPTAPDRAVALDILGTLLTGFCCVLAIGAKRDWFINIAIVWALMSFIGTIALAKYLEGKFYDE